MLIPLLTSLRLESAYNGVSMEQLYAYLGISRQGYFQSLRRLNREQSMMVEIEKLVSRYRTHKDRRAGSRSLYYNLNIKTHYGIGVNKFERLMSTYGLTLQPMDIHIVTTKSCHQSWNYNDLTAGLCINGINQLVVGDLTYLTIGKMLYYLFCLTDLYSARIVGYHIATRMRALEAKKCFDMWCKLRSAKALHHCIHHTDGGVQYFSKLYIKASTKIGLRISVAQNCLDNGHAEQRNGLIKHHLLPTLNLTNPNRLIKEFDKLIYFYNNERKQEALGWTTPVEFEQKWSGKGSEQVLILYDRSKGIRSERF